MRKRARIPTKRMLRKNVLMNRSRNRRPKKHGYCLRCLENLSHVRAEGASSSEKAELRHGPLPGQAKYDWLRQ